MNPDDFDPGPLADVEHHADGGRTTLIFVRELAHRPEKVWTALTDPAELARWAPFEPDRDLARPGAATLRMTDGSTVEEHAAEVRRAERPRRLEYTWGDDLLVWELEPTAGGTRLTLRHTVESEGWVPRVVAGWHLCVAVLERRLAGAPAPRIVGRDALRYGWQELHDAYAARLGIAGGGWPNEVFPES